MADQAGINQHDALMERLATEFARALPGLYREFYNTLLTIPEPTRLQIQNLFQSFRQRIQAELAKLPSVVDSNLALNADTLDPTLTAEATIAVQRLTQEVSANMNSVLDNEQNTIMNAVLFGAVTGVALDAVVRQLRKEIPKSVARLRTAYAASVRSFDGALTVIRGRGILKRYRYVGGVVAESRDFCRTHNDRVYTEAEIRRIWSTRTWGGKRPGDPFVVRGGYNCRHMFVPVSDE